MKNDKSPLRLRSIYLNDDVWFAMQRVADEQDKPTSEILRGILQSWMNKRHTQEIIDRMDDHTMTLEEYMNDPET